MAQQFKPSAEQPGQGGELRAQRMTADESRAVIDLWQQERVEQTGLTDKPAVPDVAEGLDITVEDVQRLLGEVRARQGQKEHKLAELHRQRTELRQTRPVPPGKYARRSRRAEIMPEIWEDAEPTVNEVSLPEAARLVKASSILIVLGLFLLGPFALLVYGIITGSNLR